MKLLLTFLATLILSACSLSMLTARPYDPVEYDYAIRIATNTVHAVHRCDNTASEEYNTFFQKVNLDSMALTEFVANKSDTEQAIPAANNIRSMVIDIGKRPTFSKGYCIHKLSNIQASARMFARSIGNTDRFDICTGDVQLRFAKFKKSYDLKSIDESEFKELSADLLKLKSIDTAGCTLEERNKIAEAMGIITSVVGIASGL